MASSNSNLKPLVTQPPFASQIQTMPRALGVNVPLQRGYMIWDKPMPSAYNGGGPAGDGRDMIRFLFNPSTVSTDYNVASASLQAAMMYTVPGDQGNLLAPLLYQTVSWSLYFDRTYELNYGGNSSAVNDPAVIGVQADIYQFMQFTGVLANLARQQANAEASVANGGSASSTQAQLGSSLGGVMMMVPCYVFFGSSLMQMNKNPNSANFNALANQLAFYGFISEWSVEYTHWTTNMVPIRASVTVSFTMLPNPPQSAETAVWRDLNKLGLAPSTAPVPLLNPPPPVIGEG